jgi:signal transduction histidine kinase
VFRPFFTTRHKGTGLGLSITRAIIERHGGVMTIESTEGVGTTVRCRVPRHAPSSAAAIEEGST